MPKTGWSGRNEWDGWLESNEASDSAVFDKRPAMQARLETCHGLSASRDITTCSNDKGRRSTILPDTIPRVSVSSKLRKALSEGL